MVSSVANLTGTILSSNASKSAAKTQAAATERSNQIIQDQYRQNREDQMPWMTQGTNAINALGDYLGTSGNTGAAGYGAGLKTFSASDFTADPGYQFTLEQGQQALERSASAKNGLLSGAALKAAQTYGEGTAAQQYDAVYNRYRQNQNDIYNKLAGVAGTGQTTAQNLGSQGITVANNIGDNLQSGAAAIAAGKIGSANAWTTGLNSLASQLDEAPMKAARFLMAG